MFWRKKAKEKEKKPPGPPRPPELGFRDTVESLTTAFVLAMVIRYFAVEAFKIPTRSMQPTLRGDPANGDRILVNKFIYDLRPPKRWDVVVFKYPKEPYLNYIKRLVGLPGEKIQILDGNIVVNGKVARKPWRVQKDLFVPIMSREVLERVQEEGDVYPAGPRRAVTEGDLLGPRRWQPDNQTAWRGEEKEIAVDASGQTFLQYRGDIVAYGETEPPPGEPRDRPAPIPTGDLAISFSFTTSKTAGQLLAKIHDGNNRFFFHLPLDSSVPYVEYQLKKSGAGTFRGETSVPFRPSKRYKIHFINVDDTAAIRVNDAEVLHFEYDGGVREYETNLPDRSVALGVQSVSGTLSELTLFRDIYYRRYSSYEDPELGLRRRDYGIEPVLLGPEQLFVLGDNSPNSNDARVWGPLPRNKLLGEAFFVWFPRWKIIR